MCVLFSIPRLNAENYYATPSDYQGYLSKLLPGDSLILASGVYSGRLRLIDVRGTAEAPIVITGTRDGGEAVFPGNACCNTVSLTRCAYLTISYLTIDGQHINYVDAVKAEGNSGNWTHHITLHHLRIINHGPEQQTVGISTKCPSWNWHIHHNIIIAAGTGMYLGNSNGEDAFINGLIEYNLIMNTTGYNLQIKRQNDHTRTTPGMPQSGRTIIRYNTFVKEEDVPGNSARPNLLVGAFPPTTAGKDDMYEIYGNFFWQNQTEKLFQGTGNLAFHHNLLINKFSGGGGIQIQEHHGRKPHRIYIFQNTIWTKGRSIFFYKPDLSYTQIVNGNAVFTDKGIKNAPIEQDNIVDQYAAAAHYLIAPSETLSSCIMTPKEDQLSGTEIDHSRYDSLDCAAYDFEGRRESWRRRGAYATCCHPEWQLAKEIRSAVHKEGTNAVASPKPGAPTQKLSVRPNPVTAGSPFYWTINYPVLRYRLMDAMGQVFRTVAVSYSGDRRYFLDTVGLKPGVYFLVVEGSRERSTVKIVVTE